VLHDCLCLETGIITKLVPEILHRQRLPPAATMTNFYWQLHHAAFQAVPVPPALPHPSLEKPFAMLVAIRQAARKYFFDGDDPTEFYHGLTLYLLGALKFKNPDIATGTLSKQAAFWAAVTTYQFLTNLPDPPARPSLLNPHLPEAVKQTSISPISQKPTVPDHQTFSQTMISTSDLPPAKTVSPGQELNAIARQFEVINQWIRSRPDDPDISKEALAEIVTGIRQEVVKGEQADLARVEQGLNSLLKIAPDISRATVSALLQPNAGLPAAIRQVVANARPDTD
jgi:hypothetical protein